MHLKTIVLSLSVAVIMLLSACSGNVSTTAKEPPPKVPVENTAQAVESPAATKAEETTSITITAGSKIITAVLDNSKTSQDFIKTLPRTMSMSRWGDREYYGKIQTGLSEEGVLQPSFKNGDVAYWPQGKSFALFFAKDASSTMPSPLVIMGKITSDLKVFDSLGESVEMKIAVKN